MPTRGFYSCFKVANGTWRAVAQAVTPAGIKKPKIIKRKTEKEARKAMENWLRESNRLLPAPSMTIAAMMDAYILNREEKGLSPNTIRDYKYLTENHIKTVIGHVAANMLTPFDVDGMCKGINGTKAAVNTRALLRAAYKRIVQKADPNQPNIAALSDPISYKPKPRVQITWADFAKIFDKEDRPVWRAHWLLLAQTGMRPDEARGLMWSEIYENEGKHWIKLAESKTPEGKKPIPLPPETAKVILELPRKALFVFPSPSGNQCNETTVGEYWREVRDKAEIPKCTLYQLRHLYGSYMARRVKDDILRRLMRHADVRTTKQYYVDAFPDDLMKAVAGVRVRPQKKGTTGHKKGV